MWQKSCPPGKCLFCDIWVCFVVPESLAHVFVNGFCSSVCGYLATSKLGSSFSTGFICWCFGCFVHSSRISRYKLKIVIIVSCSRDQAQHNGRATVYAIWHIWKGREIRSKVTNTSSIVTCSTSNFDHFILVTGYWYWVCIARERLFHHHFVVIDCHSIQESCQYVSSSSEYLIL